MKAIKQCLCVMSALPLLSACSPQSFSQSTAEEVAAPAAVTVPAPAAPVPVVPAQPANGAVAALPPACDLKSSTLPAKIIFVVDTSGSNSSATTNSGTSYCDPTFFVCAPPTDPTKSFRLGSIAEFFNAYRDKSNFAWSLITFSGRRADAVINSGSTQSPIFAGADVMQAAIGLFAAVQDDGATPYLAALDLVHLAIANDPDNAAAVKPFYAVVFLSDGYPTDAINWDGAVDQSSISSKIAAISRLAPGRLALSTAYYGTISDPKAAHALESMAAAGNGRFINVNTASTRSIDMEKLIPANCH